MLFARNCCGRIVGDGEIGFPVAQMLYGGHHGRVEHVGDLVIRAQTENIAGNQRFQLINNQRRRIVDV